MAPIVLLLDDDPAVLDALSFCLWSDGFQVRAHRHESELLDDPRLPDASCLVVSDAPPASDGLRLIERLRQEAAGVPIIFLTGRATPELRRRATAQGVQCLLEKPLIDDSLAQAMLSLLGAGLRKNP